MGTTQKRIVATGYAIVGHSGGPSDSLAPGEYVVFDEDAASHLAIEQEILSGRDTGLSIEEVDLDDERAAKQAQEAATSYNPEEHKVGDVIDYLQTAPPEEVDRVKSLEAASSRNSPTIANFEPSSGGDEGDNGGGGGS